MAARFTIRRKHFQLAIWATFILTTLIVWQGLVRRPTPIATGSALHDVPSVEESPEAANARQILRVASFNIAGGVGQPDGKFNLHRTAAVLGDLDLVGLEEVHGGSPWDPHDQAEFLGNNLHLPWLFAASETRWWRESFGNGVLCALPVTHWERLPLSTTLSSTNRSLLRLTARWRDKPLTVLITHLDRGADHDVELGAVLAAFHDAPDPVVLLADLNTDPSNKQLAAVRADPSVIDAIGKSLGAKLPPDNVDWILARHLHLRAAGLRANTASDHSLAWAELTE